MFNGTCVYETIFYIVVFILFKYISLSCIKFKLQRNTRCIEGYSQLYEHLLRVFSALVLIRNIGC